MRFYSFPLKALASCFIYIQLKSGCFSFYAFRASFRAGALAFPTRTSLSRVSRTNKQISNAKSLIFAKLIFVSLTNGGTAPVMVIDKGKAFAWINTLSAAAAVGHGIHARTVEFSLLYNIPFAHSLSLLPRVIRVIQFIFSTM